MRSIGVSRVFRALHIVLSTRRVFRNWVSAGIRYYLGRLGVIRVNNIVIKCLDGGIDAIAPDIYRTLAQASAMGIVKTVLCEKRVMIPRDGSWIPYTEFLMGTGILEALAQGWRYDYSGKYWYKGGVRFRHMHSPILEVFEYGSYEDLEVSGRVVVDVGAFVGDSPIYFVLRGARLVIALEPHPQNYAEMIDNIGLNRLGEKIVPLNTALGARPGVIKIAKETKPDLRVGVLGSGEHEVPLTTLGQLLGTHDIGERALLKMDCEGCEYDAILYGYDDVKRFDEVVFEYHTFLTGIPLSALLEKLGRDYVCENISEDFFKKHHRKIYSVKELGMLRCVKRR